MRLIDIFENRLDERSIHTVDALEKYKDNPSIYITFSEIAKVGINPQSGYDTPLGIYTYPLNAVWSDLVHKSLPFAMDRKYIHVLESTGKILELTSYKNLDTDLEKLLDIFMNGKFARERDAKVKHKIMQKWMEKPEEFHNNGGEKRVEDFVEKQKNQLWDLKISEGYRTAFVKTQGGEIWNITRLLAQFFTTDPLDMSHKSVSKAPVIWNWLFRQLGYTGVVDRNHQGIIHTNEPTQAVFFDKSSIRHVETVINHFERPIDPKQDKIIFNSFLDVVDWLIERDYSSGYDHEADKIYKSDKDHLIPFLKNQWKDLTTTGESQNFKLTIPPKQFEQEMIENAQSFVREFVAPKHGILIPIIVSEILKHPEMQTTDVWREFIARFDTKKPSTLKLLLSPTIIEINSKIDHISYETSWRNLSEKVLHHLTYTEKMKDLVQYVEYPKTWEVERTQRINKTRNKDDKRHPALVELKRLIKPLEKYLDPRTLSEGALETLLSDIYNEAINNIPF